MCHLLAHPVSSFSPKSPCVSCADRQPAVSWLAAREPMRTRNAKLIFLAEMVQLGRGTSKGALKRGGLGRNPCLAWLNAKPSPSYLPSRAEARSAPASGLGGVSGRFQRPTHPFPGSSHQPCGLRSSGLRPRPGRPASVRSIGFASLPPARSLNRSRLKGVSRALEAPTRPGLRPPPWHRRLGADGSARSACSPPCGLPGGSPRPNAPALGGGTHSDASARRSLRSLCLAPRSPLLVCRSAPSGIGGAAPSRHPLLLPKLRRLL